MKCKRLNSVIKRIHFRPDKNNFHRTIAHFEQPMATRSIGIVLTNMNMQSSVDDRVRVYHPYAEVRQLLLSNYHQLLLDIESEMGVPIPRLDVIYTPSSTTIAETKFSVIHIGRSMHPVSNSSVHSVELRDIQREIAQSIYQVYFGHMITPVWWSQQWFLMGLNRYLSGICPHLPFNAAEEFGIDFTQKVLRESTIFNGYRMEYSYYSVDEINQPNVFLLQDKSKILNPISPLPLTLNTNFSCSCYPLSNDRQYYGR